MTKGLTLLIVIFLSVLQVTVAQDDLMNLFDNQPSTEYTTATFKSTNVVIGQSVKVPAKGTMLLNIQHHFGPLNSGFYNFYGFDQAVTRLGLRYGITNRLSIGIGRTTQNKTWDASLKVKLLRQSSGAKVMPVSITYYGLMGIISLKNPDNNKYVYFSNRLAYVNQLIIARKFSPSLSLQLIPSLVHQNLTETREDPNDIPSLGAAGRIKLSNRFSFNFEYHYVLNQKIAAAYHNSLSFGIDIETGGHVFQLFLTNSAPITGQYFIPYTDGDWLKGDIHIGFNIIRTFTLVKPKAFSGR